MTTRELPLLLGATKAAAFIGVSRSRLYELDAVGLIPRPTHLDTKKRWSRHELQRWVEAGCPPRHIWERTS